MVHDQVVPFKKLKHTKSSVAKVNQSCDEPKLQHALYFNFCTNWFEMFTPAPLQHPPKEG